MGRMSALDRKSVLLDAAAAVIARDGVAAASTRAITAEAGMSLASFHYVFPSRDALLAEVIERTLDREFREQSLVAESGLSVEERVYRGFCASLGLLAERPEVELSMFELMHYALRTPGLESLARRQYERYWEAAERIVVETGVRWDRPTYEIAQVVVAMNDGIALAWLATRDTEAALRMAAVATASICGMAVPA
ncbi:TetR family transcriptional regulator [Amnibacterium flavum]|uniref:TetR family transcriptional regulator n=2 Tax=Amnibacterium flavum TaxID=2173173 RepID=A0A2V1HRW4_9MICO|nr:TetR family transcriptional regulator [Amnibacterium flavum]